MAAAGWYNCLFYISLFESVTYNVMMRCGVVWLRLMLAQLSTYITLQTSKTDINCLLTLEF